MADKSKMLTELCQVLRNWFERDIHTGTFKVEGGRIAAPFLRDKQYYRICGSIFNDGVHQFGDYTDLLDDEEFDGAVWALAIPKAVVDLAAEIGEWRSKYEGADSAALSPFTSESFGGYSYTKSSGATSQSGPSSAGGWQSVFAQRLNAWRKL